MDTICSERAKPAEPPSPPLKPFNMVTTQVIKDLHLDQPTTSEIDETANENLSIEEELNPEIEEFHDEREYFLCCIGFFIGVENIMRFPYICFANGGGVFLIPYLTALFVVAIPLFSMETAWGQLIRCKLDHKFSILNPSLFGFSVAMVAILMMTIPFYSTLFPWTMSFLLASFKSPLPWDTGDDQKWNRDYFPNELLRKSESIDESPRIVPRLAVLSFLSAILIYFTIRHGLQYSTNIMHATATVPYFIMFVFFIKGVTLPGSWLGLRFLFVPDLGKLLNLDLWMNGILQVVFSTGVSYGPLMFYAMARKPTSKIVKSSILLPTLNCFTSIFASLTTFCFLGHIASKQGVTIQDVMDDSLDLAFIAYPSLMTTLTMPNFWSVLFFSMLMLVGIDTVFGWYNFVIAFLLDLLPSFKQKRQTLVAGVILCFFLLGFLFTTTNGWYWFALFNQYSIGIGLLSMIVVETYIIGVHFGFARLNALMKERTGEKIPAIISLTTLYVSLPLMILLLIASIIKEFHEETEPWWAQALGRSISFSPLAIIALGFYLKRPSPTIDALVEKQYGKTMEELLAAASGVSKKQPKESDSAIVELNSF